MTDSIVRQQRVQEALDALKGLEGADEYLDGMVHTIMSEKASAINNEGREEQVRFLLSEGCELPKLRHG